MYWFFFALSSAIGKTLADLQTKTLNYHLLALAFYRYFVAALIAGCIAFFTQRPDWSLPLLGIIALAIIIELGAFLLMRHGLRRGEFSRLAPILGFSPVLTALFGLFVGQYLTAASWTGIVLITLGLLILNHLRWTDGALIMLIVTLLFSINPLIQQIGITFASISWFMFLVFASISIIVFFMKRPPFAFALFSYGALFSLEIFGQFIALSLSPAALVMAIKRLSVVFSSLAGIFILHEKNHLARKLFSSAIIVAGSILLVL